jgi:fructose-1,6-bisphosphatase/inositol monophosphatase family enzyme
VTARSFEPELRFAREFVLRAGQQIRQTIAEGYRVDLKADRSPVTTVDHLVNHQFIDEVRARFPTDAVLGEEASHPTASTRTWIIDPVDGTRQLILAIPVFMVAVALVHDGRPVVAATCNPSTDQTYWARAGTGAYRNGTRLAVSARDGVSRPATVCAAGATASANGLNADTLLQISVEPEFTTTPRRFPWPTVFAGCKVAEGAWDADLYSGHAPHDVAAVCLLVREAGGTVTDRVGSDQRYDRPVNGCLMSNGLIHEHLRRQWHSTYLPRQP